MRRGRTIKSRHRLFSPLYRLMLFSCLLFFLVACSQAAPVHTASPSSTQGSPSQQDDGQVLQQRTLHLPTVKPGSSCPTSPEHKVNSSFGIAQGDGPAYAAPGASTIESPAILRYGDAQHFHMGASHGWGGQKVLWFVNPHYQGFVLVRGHQLDGPHEMRFGFGMELDQQLLLDTKPGGTPWPNFASYTRLQAPGCYAYQVDGDNFSYLIIFQAVEVNE